MANMKQLAKHEVGLLAGRGEKVFKYIFITIPGSQSFEYQWIKPFVSHLLSSPYWISEDDNF